MKIATPSGPALVDLDEPDAPAFLLVITHGANGGVATPDLLAVRAAGRELGGAVARVLQPFRLAGRHAPGPEARQDEAWLTVVAALRERYGDLPLVQGGRSNGARVACRTARKASARGVIALAFPLHPPGRPEKTRAPELTAVDVPLVVVQGETDAFGDPAAVAAVLSGRANASVYGVPGDHSLKRNVDVVAMAALSWLAELSP
jgi:uncharacterized protein